MTEEKPPISYGFPSDEELGVAFDTYALAVGKVIHAWNHLHVKLGNLFVYVADIERQTALGIWNSTTSDRTQEHMFKGAVEAAPLIRWQDHPAKARDDMIWLINAVINLGDDRNNAVHAPCATFTGPDGTQMMANFLTGHSRAKKLFRKDLLVEFDWIERWAEELCRFTMEAESAFASSTYPWPSKRGKPNRRPRKILQDLLHRHQPVSPPHPPQSPPE